MPNMLFFTSATWYIWQVRHPEDWVCNEKWAEEAGDDERPKGLRDGQVWWKCSYLVNHNLWTKGLWMRRRSRDVLHGVDHPEAGQDGIPAGHDWFSEFSSIFALNLMQEWTTPWFSSLSNVKILQALTVQQRLVDKVSPKNWLFWRLFLSEVAVIMPKGEIY